MATLIAATNAVSMDEKAFHLSEVHLQSPGSRGWRRYQIIYVNRDDRLTEFRRDLGPAQNFQHAEQFRIPGGVVDPQTGRYELLHTVGELVDIADFLRDGPDAKPEMPRINLADGYHDELDRRRRWRKRQSSFGAQFKIQRDL